MNLYQNSYILSSTDLLQYFSQLLSSCYSTPYISFCLKSTYMYEIIQIMSTLYFRKQYISLVSLYLIAIITLTRIENYRDRISSKPILIDIERRKLVQLVLKLLNYL